VKLLLLLVFLQFSYLANAEESYCKQAEVSPGEGVDGFSVTFCFSSPEFMKMFALKLYDANIPYIVYEKGSIGYKSSDKDKIEVIGDELVKEYVNNKNLEMCVTSNKSFQPTAACAEG